MSDQPSRGMDGSPSLDETSSRQAIRHGSIHGLISVAAGAFGAHALKTRLDASLLANWETAARYQAVHAVLLVVVGLLLQSRSSRALRWSVRSLGAGMVVFSGTLYLLALTGQRWLGAVTPLGGLLLMVGWALLAMGATRGR